MTYDESEYLRLLEILYRVIEAMTGEALDPDGLYYRAEGLATKLFGHATSAFYLARGTWVEEFPPTRIGFFDFASIIVIARAAWEAFLVFSYLLLLPRSDEERDLRYLSYRIGGLQDTLLFPASSPEGKEVQRRSREKLDELRAKLELNPLYQDLKEARQQEILKGYWKPRDWPFSRIARESGIAEILGKHWYRLASGYAHSAEKGLLAIKEAETKEEQQRSLAATMSVAKIAMANVIHGYCGLFARASEVLKSDPEGERLVQIWLEVGRRGVE